MNTINLNTRIDQALPSPLQPSRQEDQGFGNVLKQVINGVNQQQAAANQAAERLHTGQAEGLHEVMIAMEQSNISMRLLVTMRNKVIDAYQEIMRMQV